MSQAKRSRVKNECLEEDESAGDHTGSSRPVPKKKVKQEQQEQLHDEKKSGTSNNKTIIKQESGTKSSPNNSQPNVKKEEETTEQIITLVQLLNEKGMQPSRDYDNSGKWIGKGPRNERELLRFYSEANQIEHKKKWEWSTTDPDLSRVRTILDRFKDGLRAPSRKHWNDLKNASANPESEEWEDYRFD